MSYYLLVKEDVAGVALPDGHVYDSLPAVLISSSTNAAPIAVTTATPHGLETGDKVYIEGHSVNTHVNGVWVVTVVDGDTITLDDSTGNGVGGPTGEVHPGVIVLSDDDYLKLTPTSIDGDPLIDLGFVPGSGGGGGSSTLSGLTDVHVSSPSVDEVLTWNGTKWVNEAGGVGGGRQAMVVDTWAPVGDSPRKHYDVPLDSNADLLLLVTIDSGPIGSGLDPYVLLPVGETAGRSVTIQAVNWRADPLLLDVAAASGATVIGGGTAFLPGPPEARTYVSDGSDTWVFVENHPHTKLTDLYDVAWSDLDSLDGMVLTWDAGQAAWVGISLTSDQISDFSAAADARIAVWVGAAPADLNTLNEIATALGDDANLASTLNTSIGTKLAKASNLSDLTNAATARTNLGLGSAATHPSTDFEATGVAAALVDDLSGVTNAATARTNLGLGSAATHAATDFELAGVAAALVDDLSGVTNAATARTNLGLGTAATHAATDFLLAANNLSDVVAATARTNLGLGSAATHATTDYEAAGTAVLKTLADAKGDLIAATANDTWDRLAVGTDGQVLTADAASTPGVKWATPAAGGGGFDPLSGRPEVVYTFYPTASSTFVGVEPSGSNRADGIVLSGTASDGLATADTPTFGDHIKFTGAGADTNPAGWHTNAEHRMDHRPALKTVFALPAVTTERVFVGLSASNASTHAGADDPANNYVGVRFSTGAPDTNFQFVARQTGSVTVSDSGIAPAANTVYQVVVDVATNGAPTVSLLDATGAVLASHAFTSGQSPASTTNLRIVSVVGAIGAVVRNLIWLSSAVAHRR